MGAFFSWIFGIASKLWSPFFAVISGFFVWLWTLIRKYFLRRIEDVSLVRNILSSPIYATALTLFLSSIAMVFLGLLTLLINIYIKIRDMISDLSKQGFSGVSGGSGGSDALGLFVDLCNSIGVLDAFRDTWSLWSPFFTGLLGLLGSIIYYKLVMKYIQKIAQLVGDGSFSSDRRGRA